MKKQTFNPYLPSYEYVPDGEPHIFGNRVYVYGSHDRFNANKFSANDYVCWSAPVDDLSDWKYEGVIWKKSDVPDKPPLILKSLYAPDVVEGADGRYYLYYFVGNSGKIGVAVCDTPAGEYKYYSKVRYPDGTVLGEGTDETDLWQFDPGVFRDDDGRIYLYTGMAPKSPTIFTAFKRANVNGAMGVELCEDMVTIKLPIKRIAKSIRSSKATDFFGHEFFEASSMRKFNGKYYFIYSSYNGYELCYATSDSPLGDFKYGGVLVSIGDLGISENALNYLGNTHGSVDYINGKYYVFYHRQTNRHCYSRQACAEQIFMDENGDFKQAEVTSCGLNGKPLDGFGEYEARIACHLYSKKGTYFYSAIKRPKGCHPFFTQKGKDREENGNQYIANFCDGATAGFKYFNFDDAKIIAVKVSGNGNGVITVKDGVLGKTVAKINVRAQKKPQYFAAALTIENGIKPLYFTFNGKGRLDFISFKLY